MNNISFKDFIRLSEAGMVPSMNPAVNQANQAIVNNARSISPSQTVSDPGAALGQAAMKAVKTGTIQPGAMMQALKPTVPGQPQAPQQSMMKKKMAKGMRKK